MIKAAGYIRVSSRLQAKEGESLSTQKRSIETYAKKKGWELTKIYSDEGLSGGSMKNRRGLQRLMENAKDKKFNVLVIHRLSRFCRNATDLLNNVNFLKDHNIRLESIKEQIDFSSTYGRAMLTMLGAIAELERDITAEQIHENRVARAKQKIPTAGRLPFARNYDKKTGAWSLDEEKANLIQMVAHRYLGGESLRDLVHELKSRHELSISYAHIIRILKDSCGNKWTINFKDEAPVYFDVPSILDEKTIKAIKDRINHNRTNNRRDVRRYLLSGFIRCEKCKKALTGQTPNHKKYVYKYYRHPDGKYELCKAFSSITAQKIEDAVMGKLFQNVMDKDGFEKAIKEYLPDEKFVDSLKKSIHEKEKRLMKTNKEIDTLIDMVLSGHLQGKTVKSRETELLNLKEKLTAELNEEKNRLNSLPSIEQEKEDAEIIRTQLKLYFSSEDRLNEMTFDEKRQFLHWIFDGKNEFGEPYGVYLNHKGNQIWDFFIHGRFIMGLSTLVGNLVDPEFRNDWDEIIRNADGNKTLLEYINQIENDPGYNYKTDNTARSH